MADQPSTFLKLSAFLGPAISLFLAGFSFSPSNITLPSLYALPASSSMVVAEQLYKRGGLVVAPLGVLGATCAGTAAYLLPRVSSRNFLAAATSGEATLTTAQRQTLLVTGAAFTLANLAWTGIVMKPSIDRIVEIAQSKALQASVSPAEVTTLLWKWQWQNYVRTGNSLIGAILGFYALLG